MKRLLILIAALFVCFPFHQEIPVIHEEVKPVPAHVVLITIDGVRWQDMFYGTDSGLFRGDPISSRELMPNIYHYFVDNGMVAGKESDVINSGPAHISLPGYLEIMRGHPSSQDCLDNYCNPKLDITLTDHFESAAVFASWDTIKKTVSKTPDKFVINCGRDYRSAEWFKMTLPDDKKFPVTFDDPDYRADEYTEKVVFEYLEYYRPQFLWVSLGDTDEWAHWGDYKNYLEELRRTDVFIGKLINEYPKDTLFVLTEDHGRSRDWRNHGWDLDSARVWIMMYGVGVSPQHFVKFDGVKSLSNIKPTILHLTNKEHSKNSLL